MNIVFDLDGTLADCEHRRHLVANLPRDREPQWNEFFNLCHLDRPIWPIIRVYQALASTRLFHIEIWSARLETVRPMTLDWLDQHVWHYHNECGLRMRPKNLAHLSDVELKESFLASTAFRPNLVFDDRKRVVDFWRAKGIMCAQVAPGDF